MVLPLAASNAGRLYRGDRFSCSMPAPATSSRHLYTGHRRGHIQAAPRLRAHRGEPLSPGPPTDPSFDAIVIFVSMRQQWFTHVRLLIAHPAPLTARRHPQRLTTPALDRRSLRWFGISACTATPQDPPPSLAQHGSCRRSSTSSSLPFRTTVSGGRNLPLRSLRTVRDSLPSIRLPQSGVLLPRSICRFLPRRVDLQRP